MQVKSIKSHNLFTIIGNAYAFIVLNRIVPMILPIQGIFINPLTITIYSTIAYVYTVVWVV